MMPRGGFPGDQASGTGTAVSFPPLAGGEAAVGRLVGDHQHSLGGAVGLGQSVHADHWDTQGAAWTKNRTWFSLHGGTDPRFHVDAIPLPRGWYDLF